MSLSGYVIRLMAQRFGPEWEALTEAQRRLVFDDFATLLREDYDTPDATIPDSIAEENAEEAARVYRRNIGGGNLASYVKCLEAGQARK